MDIKQMESTISRLQQTLTRTENLFENCKDGLASLDKHFNLTLFNKSFGNFLFNITGLRISKLVNLENFLLVNKKLQQKIISACFMSLAGKKETIFLNSIDNTLDQLLYELTVESKKNIQGDFEYFLTAHCLKNNNAQLVDEWKQQLELERTLRDHLISELATTLAHEINQPLTAIRAYSHGCLLRIKKNYSSMSEFVYPLEQIAKQTKLAGNIIKRMTNFINVEHLYIEETDINELIKKAIGFLYAELESQKLQFEYKFEQNLPYIKLDRIKIMQVILNLGRNSIEAFKESNIADPHILIETAKDKNWLQIHFRDNGPGIPAGLEEQIFTPKFTTKQRGSGLGLAICNHFLQAHGGKLTVQNDEKQGAWFIFSLPLM